MFEWRAVSALDSIDTELSCGDGDSGSTFDGDRIRLSHCSGLSALKLHCQVCRDVRIDRRVCNALGIALPQLPGQSADSESPIFWLSPNEWLIVAPRNNQHRLVRGLARLACGKTVALTDLSAYLEVIELSGQAATALLCEGCSVDMYSNRFNNGNYFHSRLFDVDVLIHKIVDKPIYRLYVDRSLAVHLWHWLRDGADI